MQNKIWEKYIDYADYTDVFQQYPLRNEIITNDKPNATENDLVFNNYAVERFRLNDEPIMLSLIHIFVNLGNSSHRCSDRRAYQCSYTIRDIVDNAI